MSVIRLGRVKSVCALAHASQFSAHNNSHSTVLIAIERERGKEANTAAVYKPISSEECKRLYSIAARTLSPRVNEWERAFTQARLFLRALDAINGWCAIYENDAPSAMMGNWDTYLYLWLFFFKKKKKLLVIFSFKVQTKKKSHFFHFNCKIRKAPRTGVCVCVCNNLWIGSRSSPRRRFNHWIFNPPDCITARGCVCVCVQLIIWHTDASARVLYIYIL